MGWCDKNGVNSAKNMFCRFSINHYAVKFYLGAFLTFCRKVYLFIEKYHFLFAELINFGYICRVLEGLDERVVVERAVVE